MNLRAGAAQARSRIKNRGSRRAVLPTEVRAMNENVKIDYDTAEKVMDLDGSKVYVKTIGDKTSMKIMVSFCPTFGGEICHNSEFRADDPRLQLGQVRRAEAAQAPGRLVSRVVPRDAFWVPDPGVLRRLKLRLR